MSLLKGISRNLLSKYHLLIMPLFIIILVEFLDRGRLIPVASWGTHHLLEFTLNYLIVLSLLLLVIGLIGRVRYAYWIISGILILVALISGIKFRILGLPLLPWDFVLRSEAVDMAQYLKNVVSLPTIAAIICFLIVSWLLLHKTPKFQFKYGWMERIVLACLSIFMLYSIYFDKPLKLRQAVHTIPWDQSDNYLTNGFLLTSLLNLELTFVKQPEIYSKPAIESIIAAIPTRSEAIKPVKPNIIVVLSEAFWDPTRIPGLKFSEDPIPFLHSLQQKFPSGWLLSPQFGGGTANVEFEVLTGNSMRFMPQGSIPYIQYVHHAVDSLASILTRQGYTATAINPLDNWFFNSREVYKNFGFSRYISSEFFHQAKKGPYLSDEETMNNVINVTKSTPGPDFIFTNTMENHAFFYKGKFPKDPISVQSKLPADSKAMLEVLATGLHDADKSFKQLVDYFTKSGEPTVIVFFGDHLPFLGNDYKAYRASKYITDNDPNFLTKMYQTPVVVWNNFQPPSKEKLYMSPSFLEPYVLKTAQQKGTYFTNFLDNFYRHIPVLPPKNYYPSFHIDPGDKELKKYDLLQYDTMFGNHYGYQNFANQIIDKHFSLGLGNIIIQSLTRDAIPSGNARDLIVQLGGQNLPELGKVFINGTPVPTKAVRPGNLTATVSGKLLTPGKISVQVKLIDSKKIVIKQSNILQLQVSLP